MSGRIAAPSIRAQWSVESREQASRIYRAGDMTISTVPHNCVVGNLGQVASNMKQTEMKSIWLKDCYIGDMEGIEGNRWK